MARRDSLRSDPDPSDYDPSDDDDQNDQDDDEVAYSDDEVGYSALEPSVLLRRRGFVARYDPVRLFPDDHDHDGEDDHDHDGDNDHGHDHDHDDDGRDVSRLGHGRNRNHRHHHDASGPQPQLLGFIRRLAMVAGGLYVLLGIVFLAWVRLAPPPTACVVDTAELPLFSQIESVFLTYASLPRVVLFGESDATCGPDGDSTGTRTQCRPRDGPVYPQPDDADDVATLPLPAAAYRLCETSSDGRFVPDSVFLRDLSRVVTFVEIDLRRLANSGPMDFRFTRLVAVAPGTTVTSTQFRWSTEPGGYEVVGSQATLPVPINRPTAHGYANPYMPASTASDGSTQPTARPPIWVGSGFRSVDPPLDELCDAVGDQVLSLALHYALTTQSVLNVAGTHAQMAYWEHVELLEDMIDYAHNDEPADNKTNSDRARLLHNRREAMRTGDGATLRHVTKTAHPLDSPEETPPARAHRPQGRHRSSSLTSSSHDTARTPPSFLSSVSSRMSRVQQTLLSLESSSSLSASSRAAATRPLPPYSASPLPPPRSFIGRQWHNKTLTYLLDELEHLLSFRRWDPSPYHRIDNLEPDLNQSVSGLDNATTLLQALLERVDQVTSRVPNPAASGRLVVNASYTKGVSYSVARLHDMAPFLRDVALPRLALLRGRAARGQALLQSVQSRVLELRAEVDALAEDRSLFAVPHPGGSQPPPAEFPDCTAAYTYRYFPGDLEAMLGRARRTLYWLLAEYSEVVQLKESHELAERMVWADSGTRRWNEKLVYSRWSALDDRADPLGEERLELEWLWREPWHDWWRDKGEEGARPGRWGWRQLLSWWRPSPSQAPEAPRSHGSPERRHGAEGWPVPRGPGVDLAVQLGGQGVEFVGLGRGERTLDNNSV